MELLQLAWKNLWRNRRRTLITLGAMSFSLLLVQAFHNLSSGVYAQMVASGVRSGSGHIAVYRGDYVRSREEKLSFRSAELPETIAALPGVTRVLPRVYLAGLAQSSRESRGILLLGIDPQAEAGINPFLKNLPTDQQIRTLTGRDAVIGARLAKELQIGAGNKFVITVQNRAGDLSSELFRVRGIIRTGLKEVDASMVLVGRERAAAMAGAPQSVHELAVILDSPADQQRVLAAIATLTRRQPELRPTPWEEAMPNLANAIKLDYASQKFIFVIILLIVTIGVVNTLLMSVMERVREFGVMLAVGLTPARLRALVFSEALLLGSLAMGMGTLLGILATWYLVAYGIDLRTFIATELEFGGVVFDPVLRAAWDLPWMLQMGLYVVGLCLLASLYPALKAARIAPAEAMRHV